MAQINKPTDYFNTKLYTGNGSTNAITGVGFQPDLVWLKDRDATDWHWWNDAVRGATKTIHSNVTNAESTQAASITAFNTDGFTLGNDGSVNRNNENFVSWNWKANGSGSANTDGSINSTVSANTTAGFSIVKWSGSGANATIGHGLGVAPSVVITKNLDASANWIYGGDNIGWTKYLIFNLGNSVGTANNAWNDTAPNSTVVSLGSSTVTNASANMIAYCFAEKKGYSKFGSYTGNGNADGTFVYTGFKPSLVIIKSSSYNGSNWHMYDTKRNTFNVMDKVLKPDDSTAEITPTNTDIDCLSNGFKLRGIDLATNESGGSLIYMAFAENPIVGSNNVAATAR